MRHLLVVAAAALPLIIVSPDPAEACGAKVSMRGGRMARARKASSQRTPIAAGPWTTGGKVGAGGDAGGDLKSSGGGETQAARTPPPPKRPKKVAVKRAEPIKPDETPVATDPDPGRKGDETPAEPTKPDEVKPDEVEPVAPKGKFNGRFFFANASSQVSAQAKSRLKQTARWMKANPDKSITVEGHASTRGNHDANKTLSEIRANNVKDFLVEQGVDESRIQVEGFGSERPEFQPGTNGKNRRVIIKVN